MIIISAGHHPSATGASHKGLTEYPETAVWAATIVHILKNTYRTRAKLCPTGTLPDKIRWIKEQNAKEGVSLAVELHFNSCEGGGAEGCETLYYPGSELGKQMAELINPAMAALTTKDRGVKPGWYKMDRPGIIDFYGDVDGDETPDYFLRKTPCPALILEPQFIQEIAWIKRNRLACCRALAEAIYEAVETTLS